MRALRRWERRHLLGRVLGLKLPAKCLDRHLIKIAPLLAVRPAKRRLMVREEPLPLRTG